MRGVKPLEVAAINTSAWYSMPATTVLAFAETWANTLSNLISFAPTLAAN